MSTGERYTKAIALIDEANSTDPNQENYRGKAYPKELLYAMRMTDRLQSYLPEAKESLKLAARAQHICRWQIPRDRHPMNRSGYLQWRNELKAFHAETTGKLLEASGYEETEIEEVKFLLQKKQLKRNELSQALEDVVCLVFLEHYFEPFATKYAEEKLLDILRKTWAKMSDRAKREATGLPLSSKSMALIEKAIS